MFLVSYLWTGEACMILVNDWELGINERTSMKDANILRAAYVYIKSKDELSKLRLEVALKQLLKSMYKDQKLYDLIILKVGRKGKKTSAGIIRNTVKDALMNSIDELEYENYLKKVD
jgi:hypothetical protein